MSSTEPIQWQSMNLTDEELRVEAIRILHLNDRDGHTVPNASLYPYRWFLDCAMTAIGLPAIDEKRAWQELESSMSSQWPSGMVPSIDFGNVVDGHYFPGPEAWLAPLRTTGITQPPLTAVIARIMLENAKDRELAIQSARELYPKLVALHRWLYDVRQADDSGLLLCAHPWETGMDNSPAWDEPMTAISTDGLPEYNRKDTTHVDASERPPRIFYDRCYALLLELKNHGYDTRAAMSASSFAMADIGFNALAVRASEDLVWMAEALGIDPAEPREWLQLGEKALQSLWNEDAGMFRSYDWKAQRQVNMSTSSGFMPLLTSVPTGAQVSQMSALVDEWARHVKYLVPAFDPTHERFDPRRYWRGPVWININWMIAEGFTRHGRPDFAKRIAEDSKHLVKIAGMWEYFEPNKAEGLGANDFSWTSALALHWLTNN